MSDPQSHEQCPAFLRSKAADLGLDVTASATPPVVAGSYTVEPFTCPHGTRYWIEPTGEQIAQWTAEGVR